MKDVIIIGAGLAGLNAARKLDKAGFSVQVLEARDRVGGRNVAQLLEDGNVLEMGGQWIGPTQTRMYELCEELGLEVYPTYNEGKNLLYINGKLKTMGSDKDALPKINMFELLDLGRTVSKLNKMASTIDLNEPWNHPSASEWDGQTFETWIKKSAFTNTTKEYLRLVSEAVYSAESTDFSLLHFLAYTKAGKDIETLIGVEEGAQQERVKGGTQQISQRLAELLKDKVELNNPIDTIDQEENSVTVYSGQKSWKAKKVIVAIPPTLAGRITYEPPLPANRDQLTQRLPMGSVIKIQVVYDKPFWRDEGLTGQAASYEGPVKVVFDNSPIDVDYGVLIGFMEANDGRRASDWSLEKRKSKTIECLVRYFGEKAKDYKAYYEKNWAEETYSRGCYGGHFTPGVWTAFGKYLREPIGHIHWAGTETALEWNGYMEGAVRSGERAAEEVINQL